MFHVSYSLIDYNYVFPKEIYCYRKFNSEEEFLEFKQKQERKRVYIRINSQFQK